jgi:TP901 family phage tail tape measure protein
VIPTAKVIYVADANQLLSEQEKVRKSTEVTAAAVARASKVQADAAKNAEAAARKAEAAVGKSFAKVGKDALLGIAGVGAASVDMALKVEKATASIAVAGNTGTAAAKKIESAFMSTAGSAEFSAAKIGEAYAKVAGELSSVTGHALTSAEAMKVMRAAMALTEATGGELNATTESLGKVMQVYHLRASQAAEASDILFSASRQTGVGVDQLAQTVDRIRGRLGALAPSLAESAGLMDTLAKRGVTGRLVMGALNGTFNTLLGGSKATAAAAKELGLRIYDSSGRFVGLQSVIAQLQPKLHGLTQETQLQYTKALFGASANKQLLSVILAGPQAYAAATEAVKRHGAAQSAAEKQAETLHGRFEKLKATLEDLAGELGTVLIPVVGKLTEALSHSIEWLKKHEAAAIALAGVVTTVLGAAIGVFVAKKVAAFVGGVKTMIDMTEKLAARMGLTSAAVVADDAAIEGANAAAGASFTAMAGTAVAALAKIALPIAALIASVEVLNHVLPSGSRPENLLGGNQPGESGREGEAFAEKHGYGGNFSNLGHKAGISGFQMGAIEEAAKRYGVSPATLLGVYGTETSYGKNISTSSAGAMGAFQFIPSTAKEFGYPLTNKPNEFQFKEQAEAAAKYLGQLIKQTGSVAGALAASSGHTPGSAQTVAANGGSAAHPHTLPSIESLLKAEHAANVKRAKAEGYVDPFGGAHVVVRGREDEGIDYSARPGSKIAAIGGGVIDKIISNWFKGQPLIEEHLTSGPDKGKYVYYAEQIAARVRQGQRVRAGQTIGTVAGQGTGLELGFGAGGGRTLAQATTGYKEGQKTPAAEAFSKFLASIGKPGSVVGVANSAYAALQKQEAAKRTADEKAGRGELNKLLAAVHSGKLADLTKVLDASHTRGLAKIERTLSGDHSSALSKLNRELVAAEKEAVLAVRKAMQEQTEKWTEAVASIKESVAGMVEKAGQAWEKIENAAIKGGPNAAALKSKRAEDEAESARHTEESNSEALTEAQKHLREARGNENPEEIAKSEKEVKRAEEAITAFARQQDEKRKEDAQTAEEDGLAARREAYVGMLTQQTQALEGQLVKQEVLWTAFVERISAIFAASGLVYKPEKGAGEIVAAGPPPIYISGETAQPSSPGAAVAPSPRAKAASAGAAPTVMFTGPVTMGSRRDADRLAFSLTHRLAYGGKG